MNTTSRKLRYMFYRFDELGFAKTKCIIEAVDDEEARRLARQKAADDTVEVWFGLRLVMRWVAGHRRVARADA